MLLEEEKLSNKTKQRNDLLTDKHAPYKNVDLGIFKELFLLAVGNILTLSLIITLVSLILFRVNEIDRKSISSLLGYTVLFGLLLAILGSDIKKFFPKFKNWVPYVVGLGIGLGIIVIDDVYIRVVNLFYTTRTGGNETAIRAVISSYPVSSIIVFGLVGPMCEELTYRVGIFNVVKRWNRIWAYVITAIVFGFIHFDYQGNIATEFILLPSYIIPGVLLAIAYDMYDLPCSYTAHITNNLIVIIQAVIRYRS